MEGDRVAVRWEFQLHHSMWKNVAEPTRLAERDVAPGRFDLNLDPWVDALRVLPVPPATEDDILAWLEGPLRRFFPFEKSLIAYGGLSGGLIQLRSTISSGHTPEYLASREREFDLKSRNCFSWWVATRRPFMIDHAGAMDSAGTRIFAARREFDELKQYSLGVIAAHGVIDPFAKTGTYISFSGVPRTQPSRTFAALELIAPVLHALYMQTKPVVKSRVDLTMLTSRQRELVDLAVEGLPDKAIALRLAISEHTVGNHFRAIYAKLGISRRNQLITLL
jgi:DNA-binding CsgD family transcriptional regulator